MALKGLEQLVEMLLGEPVTFYESEDSGVPSEFSFAKKSSAPFVFHGEQVYSAAPKDKALRTDFDDLMLKLYPNAKKEGAQDKPKGKFKFFGEESYTPSDVPRVSSVPAPAPDTGDLKQKPSGLAAVQDLLVKNPGISGPAFVQMLKNLQIMIRDMKAEVGASDDSAPSIDEQIQAILLKSPDISGQSMFAAMQSAGLEIGEMKAAESDSTTAQPAVLRSKKKKETKHVLVQDSRFLESSRDDGVGPTKFKVALIQEGLGNLRDCYYYTRECLEKAVAVAAFEGKKCYADHPSASEEQDRPERSVRDILGHFENVHIEEADDQSAMLVADLIIPHTQPFEWARTLVASAINFGKKYPDRELVGLSINASGDAKPMDLDQFMASNGLPESVKPKLLKAKEAGASQVRVVSEIKDAVSVDLVTEPGARGKIIEFIEREKNV